MAMMPVITASTIIRARKYTDKAAILPMKFVVAVKTGSIPKIVWVVLPLMMSIRRPKRLTVFTSASTITPIGRKNMATPSAAKIAAKTRLAPFFFPFALTSLFCSSESTSGDTASSVSYSIEFVLVLPITNLLKFYLIFQYPRHRKTI